MGCIQGLANALSGWDKEGKDGAVVVISHDREFCEKVGFTHVGTVKDGKLVLEQASTLFYITEIMLFVHVIGHHFLTYTNRITNNMIRFVIIEAFAGERLRPI